MIQLTYNRDEELVPEPEFGNVALEKAFLGFRFRFRLPSRASNRLFVPLFRRHL